MNSKGNSIAVILVTIAILTVVVLSTQQVPQTNISGVLQKTDVIYSETETAVITGINSSSNVFMKKGFMNKDVKYWYINYPIVPTLKDLNNDFKEILDIRITKILEDLEIFREYFFDFEKSFVIPIIPENVEELAHESVSFEYEIYVTVKEGNDFKKIMLNKIETIPHKNWLFYKNISEWFETTIIDEEQGLKKLLGDNLISIVECELAFCECDGIQDVVLISEEDIIAYINQKNTPGIDGLKEKVIQILDEKFEELDEKFLNYPSISCDYSIKEYLFEIDINSYQKCFNLNQIQLKDCSGTKFLRKRDSLDISDWYQKITLEEKNLLQQKGQTIDESSTNSQRNTLSCNGPKDEYIAVNPKLLVDLELKCVDRENVIRIGQKEEHFKIIIDVKIALENMCNTPTPDNLNLNETTGNECLIDDGGGGENGEINGNGGGPGPGPVVDKPCIDLCLEQGFEPDESNTCEWFSCSNGVCERREYNCNNRCYDDYYCRRTVRPTALNRTADVFGCVYDDPKDCSFLAEPDNACIVPMCKTNTGECYTEIKSCPNSRVLTNCGKGVCDVVSGECYIENPLDCSDTNINPSPNPDNKCLIPSCNASNTCTFITRSCAAGQVCNPNTGNCVGFGGV